MCCFNIELRILYKSVNVNEAKEEALCEINMIKYVK